jgi:hypothetical protein
MGSISDFDRNIEAISSLVKDAAANFEVFNCCSTDSQKEKYAPVFAKYPTFFSTIIPTALIAAITTVYKLFDSRAEAVTLDKIIEIAERTGIIDAKLAGELRMQASSLDYKAVRTLRNQALSHRNDTKTLEAIFNEAKLTPKELEALFKAATEIVNKIRHAAGLTEFDIGKIGDVVHTDTDNVLLALAKLDANDLK